MPRLPVYDVGKILGLELGLGTSNLLAALPADRRRDRLDCLCLAIN